MTFEEKIKIFMDGYEDFLCRHAGKIDTIKEIVDWLNEHPEEAQEIEDKINNGELK